MAVYGSVVASYYRLAVTDLDATLTTLKLAASEISEADFADWIRANLALLSDD